MTTKWSDAPCHHYFPTDGGDEECASCGWLDEEHETPVRPGTKGNGMAPEIKIQDVDVSSKVDILLQIVAQLQEQVAELVEQNAEIIEKLDNVGTPGTDFRVDRFDS